MKYSIKNLKPRYIEQVFITLLLSAGLPEPEKEFRFHPERRWRFDYCYADEKLAIEIEGGVYTKQAHGSITGIKRDIEKYSNAAAYGYRIIRVLPEKLHSNETIELIKKAYYLNRSDNVS